ncbi:outer membrane protein [Methylobacterium haplocladii]|uniref:Outer membrane protein beta-barrel domain-containing protein n=1 Tax=Methylobacterium haplocladii TaxID=1176176 RepID=A0A512IRH8_9HYPH|nr:outer membrane beta-barrel protein [Methylobacterium haplocladii]GEP00317.1 hypothetical protein MHA02_27040 [Methylobacterium haplocladii]GJD86088.1 Outer membrane protein A [Methylobacterium haplocladii]GLS60875.1 hypothetical protein GCM10007887_35640 [Methylobacterium haplocladii]
MRTLTIGFLAATTLGCLSTAQAADLDYDYLRGPEYEPVTTQIIDWSGGYVGGHGGYSSSAFGFKNVFQPIVANALRATVIESDMSASSLLSTHDVRKGGTSYGVFAGYNMQFDEAVVGIEFDYSRFDIAGVSADAIGRTKVTTDGYQSTAILSGTSRTKIEDLGTIRARAGYAIGSFLPFVTGGLAIGRARIGDSVDVQAYAYDRTTYQSNVTNSQSAYVGRYGYSSFDPTNPGAGVPAPANSYGSRKTKVVGGFTLGAGLEYAITSNILLRGEYQYVLLNDFDGHKININTVRGGAAYKF